MISNGDSGVDSNPGIGPHQLGECGREEEETATSDTPVYLSNKGASG